MLRRCVVYGVITLGAWGTWEVGSRVAAPGKIDRDLATVKTASDRADIVVELGFAPEATHIRMFQKMGAVVGIDHMSGNTRVRIVGVASDDVDRLARRYWIRRITLLRREVKG